MKILNDCLNRQQIRSEIERIDRQIIAAFGNRFVDVKTALQTNETNLKPSELFETMLQKRRVWAEDEGLNPDVIEELYRELVNYSLEEGLKHPKAIS